MTSWTFWREEICLLLSWIRSRREELSISSPWRMLSWLGTRLWMRWFLWPILKKTRSKLFSLSTSKEFERIGINCTQSSIESQPTTLRPRNKAVYRLLPIQMKQTPSSSTTTLRMEEVLPKKNTPRMSFWSRTPLKMAHSMGEISCLSKARSTLKTNGSDFDTFY